MTEGSFLYPKSVQKVKGRTPDKQAIKKDARQFGAAHRSIFVNVFQNIVNFAAQQLAKLVEGVGGNVVAVLHGVIVGKGKAHFSQTVRGDALFFHGSKQRFIAYHLQIPPSITSIESMCGF